MFTKLDLTSAYHQIRSKEGNKSNIVFWTRYSHFKYKLMFFRLFNDLESFQGYINKILAKALDIFVIVCLDDILIYIEDPGLDCVKVLSLRLDVLRRHKLFVNLK